MSRFRPTAASHLGLCEQPLRSFRASVNAPFTCRRVRLPGACRQSGAIDGHERLVASSAALMEGAGHEFLAGPALAGDEHRGIGVGNLCQLVVQFLHRGTLPEEFFKSPHALDGLAQRADLLLELPAFIARCKISANSSVRRLGDKVVSPARIAAMAVSRLPKPSSTMTGTSGRLATRREQNWMPSIPGIFRSVKTTSKSSRQNTSKPPGRRAAAGREIAEPEVGLQQVAHALLVVNNEDS